MKTDDIRQYHFAEPFKPFTLHLSDGRKFRVAHRECLAYWPGRRTAIVFMDGPWHAVDILHIVSIDDKPVKRSNRKKSA